MKIKNIIKTSTVILSIYLLTGCAEPNADITSIKLNYIPTDKTPVPSANQNAQSDLAQSADSVSDSLQQLSAIQKAVNPEVKIAPPVNPKLIGMDQESSVDWNGPIEPLLKQIAKASHYKLSVIGSEPAVPVIVAINEKNKPLATILRNATFQAAQQADITVYPSSKTIELRYYHI